MKLFSLVAGAAMVTASAVGISVPAVAGSTSTGHQVSAEGAWCWFADPRAIHYENADKSINASWLAYIDVHGNIKASQYDFNTGKRNEVLVRSYFQPDDHNNPTLLVLPDERVLIIYSRHTDEPAFYYRVSRRPGDITSLGEEKKIVTKDNTTYPSPFILSDDPEHIYMCWRGIGWHPTIARLTLPDADDNVSVDWGPFQIVQSTGARPYAKYCSNGKDRIFVTYTTGHPDNEQPNWLYCNAININAQGSGADLTINPTLEDINGNKLSTIAEGKFNVSKTDSYMSQYPLTVVDATPSIRDWVWQIVLDKDGKPVIPMVKISGDKTSHKYCLAKWSGSAWGVTELADGGKWFHSSDNTEKCYSGGEAIDPEDTNTLYLSIPTQGTHGNVYEIWKYTVDDQGNVTAREQVTENSEKNNVRPYVLNNHKDSPLRLGWLHGDYYYWMVNKSFPSGFPTAVYCDYEYTPATGDLTSKTEGIIPGDVKSSSRTEIAELSGAFSVSFNLSINADTYEGTILESPGLSYALDAKDELPYATVNGLRHYSTNRLLNSDNWATGSGGTNGDYWPTKLGVFNLTVTYDGETLTVYRDGLIDQCIQIASLTPGTLTAGGFNGWIGNISYYDRALNQDEVKELIAKGGLADITIPSTTDTDMILPSKAGNTEISWSSDNNDIIDGDGTFRSPAQATDVKLTATAGSTSRDFTVTALPREIKNNLLARYEFEESDIFTDADAIYVKDMSDRENHLRLYGNAKADGQLNLRDNTASGFQTNGYAVAPAWILDNLRSYTVMFTATPSSVSGHPRFYDFGVNSSNSLFLRTEVLSAGIKYLGGTTTMVNSSKPLAAGTTYQLAATYDARTGLTKIYINDEETASGTDNVNEPYMLALVGNCGRNYIGRTQWWDSGVANDNQDYIGTIDSFMVFNTALTPDEFAEARALSIPDGIEEIRQENHDNVLYDLQGRVLDTNATPAAISSLLPGIYILNGKKIAITH